MKGTTTFALDLAKQKIHVRGVNERGQVTIDKEMSRKKVFELLSNHQPAEIFMESCAGSNWICQQFEKMGHRAKRISAQHVKPFASHQKNDRNDAKAILEAGLRPHMLFVAVKSRWQQDLQSLHKIRDGKLKLYRALNSQIRGILFEYGIALTEGTRSFFKSFGVVIDSAGLSPVLVEEIKSLYAECLQAYRKAEDLEKKITAICGENPFFKKAVEEIAGVGPIVASRFLSTIGNANNFRNGRQVSAHLGLVPKQHSSGGRTRLMGITKHGDVGLRTLLIQGARAKLASLSLKQYPDIETQKLKLMIERKGFNVAAVALANRNARQLWAILKKSA